MLEKNYVKITILHWVHLIPIIEIKMLRSQSEGNLPTVKLLSTGRHEKIYVWVDEEANETVQPIC